MDEDREEENGTCELLVEGEAGNLLAVLVFHCPECGQTSKFTAKDEDDKGEVHCPCGESTIALEDDGLRGGQRKLDEINRGVKDLGDTFKRFGR